MDIYREIGLPNNANSVVEIDTVIVKLHTQKKYFNPSHHAAFNTWDFMQYYQLLGANIYKKWAYEELN